MGAGQNNPKSSWKAPSLRPRGLLLGHITRWRSEIACPRCTWSPERGFQNCWCSGVPPGDSPACWPRMPGPLVGALGWHAGGQAAAQMHMRTPGHSDKIRPPWATPQGQPLATSPMPISWQESRLALPRIWGRVAALRKSPDQGGLA